MARPHRFQPVDPARLDVAQQAIADRLLQGPRAKLGPVWRALLHSPGIAAPVEALGRHVRYGAAIPQRLTELMILVMARDRGIRYLCEVHAPIARAAGLDAAVVDAVLRGDAPANLTDDEALVHRLARQAGRRPAVPRRLSDAIAARFGEAGLVELIGLAGYYYVVLWGLDLVLTPEQRFPRGRRAGPARVAGSSSARREGVDG